VDVTSVRDGRRRRRRRLRRSFADLDGARPGDKVEDPVTQAVAGAPGEAFAEAV
jgi:hypothetical protein